MKQITANDIKRLLAVKHSKDIFVTECKNGQSWGGNRLMILDAWAMRRSWSPLTTIGYEIKVDRSDYERDNKWTRYTPYVHEFYFVCPAGLIKKSEMPRGVGLIWTTLNGEKLITKLKAVRYEPEPRKHLDLLYYVLMARTVIVADMHAANAGFIAEPDRLGKMREWVETAEKRRELAYFVNAHIHLRFEDMRDRVRQCEQTEQTAKRFADRLQKLGIVWDMTNARWMHEADVMRQIAALDKGIPNDLLQTIDRCADRMKATTHEITKIRGNK